MNTQLVDGFRFIGTKENVCGGDPIIVGTRLQPKQIVAYGSKLDAMEDFDLTKEQVEECYMFIEKQS